MGSINHDAFMGEMKKQLFKKPKYPQGKKIQSSLFLQEEEDRKWWNRQIEKKTPVIDAFHRPKLFSRKINEEGCDFDGT